MPVTFFLLEEVAAPTITAYTVLKLYMQKPRSFAAPHFPWFSLWGRSLRPHLPRMWWSCGPGDEVGGAAWGKKPKDG